MRAPACNFFCFWFGFLRGRLGGLLPTAGAYFYFSLMIAVVDTLGTALALAVTASFNNLQSAQTMFGAIGAVMQTVCGFFLTPNVIPPWVIWVYYISYLKYALEGLFWNQFAETVIPSVGYLLTQYFYVDQTQNRWTNLVVLMWYPLVLHVLAALALYLQLRRRVVVVSSGPASPPA